MSREKGKWNRFHRLSEEEVNEYIIRAEVHPMPEGKGFINIAKQNFADGNVTVICRYPENSKDGKAQWVCKCNLCGSYFVTTGKGLRTGKTKSCGCLVSKKCAERNTTHGIIGTAEHGLRLAKVHIDMIRRCYNKNREEYSDYGARGIYIVPEWYTPNVVGNPGFVNFYHWMIDHGYHRGLSIDRIDNDGPYAPWNCRLVGVDVQARNKRNNKWITDIDGERLVYADFETKHNLREGYISMIMRQSEHGGHMSLDLIVHNANSIRPAYYDKKSGEYKDKYGFIHIIDRIND